MARLTPDPSFYPSPASAAEAPPETHAYVATLNTGKRRPRAGRDHRARPRAGLAHLRPAGRPARHARRRRRAAPLRLERLLVGAVPVGAAPARRAPLPARPGPALLAHPRHRRQGAAHAQARQGDRGRRDRPQGRLHAPAHRPLRPRRDLRLRARQPGGRRAGRHLPARPRRLLGQGRLGGRPRPAGARLRLLVAPRLRHGDHVRVGHAEDGRGRAARRAAARQQVRPQAPRLGPQERKHVAGDRPRPRAPDGARAAARRTTRARPTASSASSPRPPTCRPRSGCGSAPTTGR